MEAHGSSAMWKRIKNLWLKPFTSVRNEGTTLAELMVASGLLAVVATAATAFLSKVQSSEYSARGQTLAIAELDSWQAQNKRDLDWREINKDGDRDAYKTAVFGNIELYPMAMNPSTKRPGQYKIWYNAYCQGMPGDAKAFYTKKYGTQFNFSASYLASHYPNDNLKCMKAINCPDGTFPQIVRSRDNHPELNIRKYPGDVFGGDLWRGILPGNTGKITVDHVAAAAVCVESDGGSADRVLVEAAIVDAEGHLKFERRELLAPRRNTAKIQQIAN